MNAEQLTEHLMIRLREVQERLGMEAISSPEERFADAVDSMGLVEFVGVVASDCGVKPDAIESAVGRRFSTVSALAKALIAARIEVREQVRQQMFGFAEGAEAAPSAPLAWLSDYGDILPRESQGGGELNQLIGRPSGWIEERAGIRCRRLWGSEHPFDSLDRYIFDYLSVPHFSRGRLAALLVASEAPWQPLGQAAALHARLALPAHTPAIEIGGACLGWLHGLYLARRLTRKGAPVLLVAIEAPSRWLTTKPGPEGEAAALFGDAAGYCLVHATPVSGSRPLRRIVLGCDGHQGDLIRLRFDATSPPALEMDGPALATRAVRQLCDVVRQVCEDGGVRVEDLESVYIHAGNGRMPALVARQLGVDEDVIVSTTATTGNLGTVSLLAGLNERPPGASPFVVAAIGAGLCWGAALFDPVVGS